MNGDAVRFTLSCYASCVRVWEVMFKFVCFYLKVYGYL
jgi:hypothetical protein